MLNLPKDKAELMGAIDNVEKIIACNSTVQPTRRRSSSVPSPTKKSKSKRSRSVTPLRYLKRTKKNPLPNNASSTGSDDLAMPPPPIPVEPSLPLKGKIIIIDAMAEVQCLNKKDQPTLNIQDVSNTFVKRIIR